MCARMTASVSGSNGEDRKERWFTFAVFFLLGTTSVFPWNCLLNIIPSLLRVIYPNVGSFTDTTTATYFTIILAICLLTGVYPATHAEVMLLGLLGIVVHLAAMLLMCSLLPESAVWWSFHLYGATAGCCVAIVICAGFAMAATLPQSQTAAVSSGLGFSGILTFAVWMICDAVPAKDIKTKTLRSIWILHWSAIIVSICTIGLFIVFLKRSWLQRLFAEQNLLNEKSMFGIQQFGRLQHEKKDTEVGSTETINDACECRHESANESQIDNNEDKTKQSQRQDQSLTAAPAASPKQARQRSDTLNFGGILRRTWDSLVLRFFVFFQSYLIFPTIGPVGWKTTILVMNLCMGAFQLFDFLGRYLPHFVPILKVTERTISLGLLGRIGLIVAMILIMTFREYNVAFLSHGALHIILTIVLAFTNGWFSTLAAVYLPHRVRNGTEKAMASSLGVAAAFVGVVSAQWSSKLFKLLLEPTASH